MYHKQYIHSFIICWVITMHCYSKLAANEYKLYHKSLANITLCSSSNYGSPISRNLARFYFALRDLISRDSGYEFREIKKGVKCAILIDKFSIYNININKFAMFFLSPNISDMQNF